MNLKYLKYGILLALIGGILGIMSFVWMMLIRDPLASFYSIFSSNPLLVWLGYLSLIASIIIVFLTLALAARKLLTKIKTILILIIVLGIIEALAIVLPYIAVIGGVLAIIGGILAWIGLRPAPAAKPAKPAAVPVKKGKVAPIRMKSIPILQVEGIGKVYAKKLAAAGIKTTGDLLKAGKAPSGRAELANKTNISDELILDWVRGADLIRVKGISEQYSDLLDEAGIKDVPDLAKQKAESLHAKLDEVNKKRKLVKRLPTLKEVGDWISYAKSIPKMVEY
ncbi:MAG: DUF4332 domain-containing protein [Candidatus Jordarchaeum sp.]|uniref:DUF4332 domain-containing protein n=1 Tax=Candidatus Jordarchaeum sp. TaxID=2823881 RepID=UPI00404B0CCE